MPKPHSPPAKGFSGFVRLNHGPSTSALERALRDLNERTLEFRQNTPGLYWEVDIAILKRRGPAEWTMRGLGRAPGGERRFRVAIYYRSDRRSGLMRFAEVTANLR